MKIKNQNEFDYMTELEFAKKFIKNEVALSEFCYIDDYHQTIHKESKNVVGKKILFIGTGPMPLSVVLFKERGFICDGLDYSLQAVRIGEKVLKKMGHEDINLIHADAREFNNYKYYDTIILALEAGIDEKTKQEIFQKISKDANVKTKILVRSSNLENSVGSYVNSQKYLSKYFSIKKRIPTFSGYCSTFVCA